MRIGIDCLSVNPLYKGGQSTYLFGLLDGFNSIKTSNNSFIIFCRPDNKSLFNKFSGNDNFEIITINKFNSKFKKKFLVIPRFLCSVKLWEVGTNLYHKLIGLNNRIESNCDVLYTATTTLNFYNLKIPTIVSMHDIQQYHYPEYFTSNELNLRKLTFVNSAKYANYFQASSQFIKNDILKHFSWLKKEQIFVIHEGVNIFEFSSKKNIDICEKYQLPKRFLFFPAQLWKHKNHITILKALKKLNDQGITIPLVMTGAQYSATSSILDYIKFNHMDYVFYLGLIDFNDVVLLYQNATFFITGVLYESSSLPILESAAAGTPVIASKTPPNIEMSQNIKMSMFNPLDVSECSRTIKECWFSDVKEIEVLSDVNSKNIQLYSWDIVANNYIDFIESNIHVK